MKKAVLLGLFALLLLSGCTSIGIKNCDDFDCFYESYLTCTPAKYSAESPDRYCFEGGLLRDCTKVSEYTIIGKVGDKCKLTVDYYEDGEKIYSRTCYELTKSGGPGDC